MIFFPGNTPAPRVHESFCPVDNCASRIVSVVGERSIPLRTLAVTFSPTLFGLLFSSWVREIIFLVKVVSLHFFLSWFPSFKRRHVLHRPGEGGAFKLGFLTLGVETFLGLPRPSPEGFGYKPSKPDFFPHGLTF